MNYINVQSISVFDRSLGELVNSNRLHYGYKTIFDAVNPVEVPYILVKYKKDYDVDERIYDVKVPVALTSEKIQSLVKKISLMSKIDTWAKTSLYLFFVIPPITIQALIIAGSCGALGVLAPIYITGLALTFILPACGLIIEVVSLLIAEQFVNFLQEELQQTQLLIPFTQTKAIKPMNQAFVFMVRSYADYLKPHFIKACEDHDIETAFKFRRFFQAYNCMPELSEEENSLARFIFTFERRRHALALANF